MAKSRAGARQKPKASVFATTPVRLTAFKQPRRRGLGSEGDWVVKLRPDPELPTEVDADLQQRYQAWQQTHGGSILQFVCWDFLANKKHLFERSDFYFQFDMYSGNRFIVDFYFPAYKMAWFIQTGTPLVGAAIAKIMSQDITAVLLYENDILSRTNFILEEALRGEGAHPAGLT